MLVSSTRLWLKTGALVVIVAGLVFALGAFPPLAGPAAFLIDFTFWPIDGAEALAGVEARLMCGVLGAVMTGWGTMLWLIADRLYPLDPALARTVILASVGIWFVLDCLASLAVGAPLNLAFNLVFLALFAIPLLRADHSR
jgi:hypothetical protein